MVGRRPIETTFHTLSKDTNIENLSMDSTYGLNLHNGTQKYQWYGGG